MPITNLAIQRARWRELSGIFVGDEVVNVRPAYKFSHSFFVICIRKLTALNLERLRLQGYSIVKFEIGNHMAWLTVWKWEMEKMNEASREFLATLEDKTMQNYNLQLEKEETQRLRGIIQEKNKQLKEERLKIEQLCHRLVILHNEAIADRQKESPFAKFFEYVEVAAEQQ